MSVPLALLQKVMTSGAESSGGPIRSEVGTAISSKMSGIDGPGSPKPMLQLWPPNTRENVVGEVISAQLATW